MPISLITANSQGGAPCFSAYASASQTVTTDVMTKTSLDTKEYDTNGCFNNTGSTVTLNGISVPAYSFAPNVAGYYQTNLFLRPYASSIFYVAFPTLYKNGAIYLRPSEWGVTANQSLAFDMCGSVLVYLNGTTDYISLYGFVSGSGTCQFQTAGSPYTSRLQAYFVRSA